MNNIISHCFFSVTRIFGRGAMRTVAMVTVAGLLHACGGGASTETNPITNNSGSVGANQYTGPNPITEDVRAYQTNVWQNINSSSRCGACHVANGQAPQFVRGDDINLAYTDVLPLVDLDNPANSRLVTKVAGGHNCWESSDAACRELMISYVERWAAASGGATGGRQIQLVAPVSSPPGTTKTLPADVNATLFETTVWPVLTANCAGCHADTAQTPQSPFFASSDVADAYVAAQPKINLNNPAASRLVVRLRSEFHNCWTNCTDDSQDMQDEITAMAGAIVVTPVASPTVFSDALSIPDGVIAAGGNRYEDDVIALYEFREGVGSTISDLSGVSPELQLTISGDVDWVGGYGIQINDGKAQGSTANSKKLHDRIKFSGEYSIEAWVVPANVVQEGPARIVSYSAGTAARNFTLGQTMYNYDFLHRSSTTDANGEAALSTADGDEDLQASLQHVVITFDPINGRQIFVNGVFTDDVDNTAPGNLSDWDDTFALVLGNEVSNNRLWQGIIRLVAIHERALTPAQIQQNFDAGVGAKFFLLFGIGGIGGVPAGSYIMFEVEEYDNYSYLFNKPTFVNLNAGTVLGSIAIEGMRIGINSKEASVGQSFANLSVTVNDASYDPATGQVLSPLGTIISKENGADTDEFYLTFEMLGTQPGVVSSPGVLPTVPLPAPGEASEIGLRTFDEINASMAAITGVDPADIQASYLVMRQSLPSVETIEGFLAAQQMSITQLAIEYCDALVESSTLRDAFFDTAVAVPTSFDFDAPVGTAFSGGKATVLVDDLYSKMIGLPGTGADLSNAPTRGDIQQVLVDGYIDGPNTVTSLLDTMSSNCAACDTKAIVKGLCGAVLGSSTMLVQ
jgi:hypothetical protein